MDEIVAQAKVLAQILIWAVWRHNTKVMFVLQKKFNFYLTYLPEYSDLSECKYQSVTHFTENYSRTNQNYWTHQLDSPEKLT